MRKFHENWHLVNEETDVMERGDSNHKW